MASQQVDSSVHPLAMWLWELRRDGDDPMSPINVAKEIAACHPGKSVMDGLRDIAQCDIYSGSVQGRIKMMKTPAEIVTVKVMSAVDQSVVKIELTHRQFVRVIEAANQWGGFICLRTLLSNKPFPGDGDDLPQQPTTRTSLQWTGKWKPSPEWWEEQLALFHAANAV